MILRCLLLRKLKLILHPYLFTSFQLLKILRGVFGDHKALVNLVQCLESVRNVGGQAHKGCFCDVVAWVPVKWIASAH